MGAPLTGRVAIIDDVITAGTAVREVLTIIEQAGAQTAAVVVGLNRQERGQGSKSAIQELKDECGIPVISIISLNNIVEYLEQEGDPTFLTKVRDYRQTYGVDE